MATKRKVAVKKIKKTSVTSTSDRTTSTMWAWVLILLGSYFLFGNAFGIRFSDVISISLIVVGVIILLRRRQV